jgi:hypothetical protein
LFREVVKLLLVQVLQHEVLVQLESMPQAQHREGLPLPHLRDEFFRRCPFP